MAKEENKFPHWVSPMLKGICYWLGYKKILYSTSFQIPELAIHTEIWAILSYFRSTEKYALKIVPEKSYIDLVRDFRKISESEFRIKFPEIPKADIAIYTKNKSKSSKGALKIQPERLSHVIEIKKYEGNNKKDNIGLIKTELKELQRLKELINENVDYYLLIISQDLFPTAFLSSKEIKKNLKKKNPRIKRIQNESKVPITKKIKSEIEKRIGDFDYFEYEFVNKNKTIKNTETIIEKNGKEKVRKTSGIISAIIVKI
jgi:hypothetical protein